MVDEILDAGRVRDEGVRDALYALADGASVLSVTGCVRDWEGETGW